MMKKRAWILCLLICFLSLPGMAENIRGQVRDSVGTPVPGVSVVLCDQATGIPVSTNRCRPFTESESHPPALVVDITGADGRFIFTHVPTGLYRAVAQSWPGTPGVRDPFNVNGTEIILWGTADRIPVPSPEALCLKLQPAGNGTAILDQQCGNDGSLLVISPMPLGADPVLGFAAWQGPFLRQAIGMNRMPSGRTVVRGLPEGRIHFSVFANDNNGGIGETAVDVSANDTLTLDPVPIVCGWSNGRHDPPPGLMGTFEEMQAIAAAQGQRLPKQLRRWLAAEGVHVRRTRKNESPLAPFLPHLQETVTLPSGARVPFKDILASLQYIGLQRSLQPGSPTPSAADRTPATPSAGE